MYIFRIRTMVFLNSEDWNWPALSGTSTGHCISIVTTENIAVRPLLQLPVLRQE
jgi:hypothetical protein